MVTEIKCYGLDIKEVDFSYNYFDIKKILDENNGSSILSQKGKNYITLVTKTRRARDKITEILINMGIKVDVLSAPIFILPSRLPKEWTNA